MNAQPAATVNGVTDLRATVAKRREDTRIARKHVEQAAERTMTAENLKAYDGAVEWFETCCEAERVARVALIKETS